MIEIIDRQRKSRIGTERIRRLVLRLARRYRLKDPEITVVFGGDTAIRRLNRTFRDKDITTDVLSFPLGERGPDGRFHLGDIIISVPRAARQAAGLGHSLEAELGYLVVHGFLHLLGYGHFRGHEDEETRVLRLLRKEKLLPLPPA